jgi:polyisoprenoid-binding protein YceI
VRRTKWLLAVPLAAAALLSGGTWAYIEFLHGDSPERLALGTPAQAAAPAVTAARNSAAGVDGTWKATTGSQGGYRVKENLFGQDTEAVGRTNGVDGELVIAGTTVKAATVTVDMASVASDESRRDNQFRGRIMNVAAYPTATFTLTKPIELPAVSTEGTRIAVPATGDLTLRGTTRKVTADLSARRHGDAIEVTGAVPVVFSDYGIPNPSFGPVSTEDHGELEFLVVFTRP